MRENSELCEEFHPIHLSKQVYSSICLPRETSRPRACLMPFDETVKILHIFSPVKANCCAAVRFTSSPFSFMHQASVSPHAASLWRGVCYDPVSAKSILINFKVQVFISWPSRERLSSKNDESSSFFLLLPLPSHLRPYWLTVCAAPLRFLPCGSPWIGLLSASAWRHSSVK